MKFRRPLRVGSNLILTLPAKLMVITAVLSIITALLLATVFSLHTARKLRGFKPPPNMPAIFYSALFFYACITALFLYYITSLLFICARYMSAPWIQRSYLTDRLPWYIRVLYWEKLPSILKVSMWQRRMQKALVTCLLGKRTPYEVQADRPKREHTTLLWRLKRIVVSPWRSMQNVNGLPRGYTDDYTDDYDVNIPLLPSNEIDPAFRDSHPSSPVSPPPDHPGIDPFDCVGEENARILRAARHALIATRADGTGDGMWDIFNDTIVAGQWVGRIEKRRKLRDILFDLGLIRGR